MNIYEKLGEALNVELTDDYNMKGVDLNIDMWNTADGYCNHVIYSDPSEVDWEYDVFYYEPSFDIVIERIQMAANDKGGKAIVRISDFDMYLPEGDVEEFLEDFEPQEKTSSTSESLEGKTIVITGVFENHSRDELKKMIESKGGKASSSVTKNTAFILSGSNMGPKKKLQAEELGIKIIGEDEFIKQYIS
jgi:NAD-dependent DNA ligase